MQPAGMNFGLKIPRKYLKSLEMMLREKLAQKKPKYWINPISTTPNCIFLASFRLGKWNIIAYGAVLKL